MTAFFRLIFAGLLALMAQPLVAQTPDPEQNVVLIADSVYLNNQDMLVAEGHVEALQGDVRLRAHKIEYDKRSDIITVTGPIHVEQGESLRIVASYAQLDSGFRNALLQSARVVLNDQIQLASGQMRRVNGRYNVLDKTAVTSCRVCDDGKPPLWQIRAQRVVHDEKEQQLYFDHAQLRVLDMPIAYFPQLRMPDPTLKRSSGFLIPELHRNSRLGFGAKIPYFLTMGDHRDLLLTPFLAEHTTTLELRYRQAFRNGRMSWKGAISDDNITSDQPRFYVFGTGKFALPKNYELFFNIKSTSDASYLLDYDYSDEDRLNSDITVRRTLRDENSRFAVLHYESLRDGEDNTTLPSIVGLAETERRFFPTTLGGEARLSLNLHSHYRKSVSDVDGVDTDTITDGRDMTRATASAWWRRSWTLPQGLRAGLSTELTFDGFHTRQDAIYAGTEYQFTPTVAADLRYPMSKVATNGSIHVLEPLAQVSWSGGSTLNIANDESTRVEFDEGNLVSLSRFPSTDRHERGLVGAIGVNWSRFDPAGWRSNISIGQVFQQNAHSDFSLTSGLSGSTSDFLMAGQIITDDGLTLLARGLLNPSNGLSKASARAGWTNDKIGLDASYIWLVADPQEDRAEDLSEWVIDTSYRMNRHWTALADWRYDVAAGQSAEAGIGLEYRNECVKIGLSVSRSFITTTTVAPSTNIGLTVALLGFSVSAKDKSYNRTCSANAG